MVMTRSQMLNLGTEAPAFRLRDTTGRFVSFEDQPDAAAFLVIFMCNHCPFVKHIRHELASMVREYQPRGVAVFGINSNDPDQYPDDSPAKMAEEVLDIGYTFPYLFDDTQAVAKAYRAACTPDFYLFDRNRKLVYRGRFDASRPGSNVPIDGQDLRAALDATLGGGAPRSEQVPSIGCNIKWKPGNAPEWFH